MVKKGKEKVTQGKNIFWSAFSYVNERIMSLNNSKLFAGVIMIMLNVGSKFISIQFSKSTEEYLKQTVTKQLLVFAMAWMGTRDIYNALILVLLFTILSEHLFNEESPYCVVPHEYRVLEKLMDTNGDGVVSEQELSNAISVLEKAKKEKQKESAQNPYKDNFATKKPNKNPNEIQEQNYVKM